jgi:DNA adenine methylase
MKERTDLARPILKWAGGKRQLLPALRRRVPKQYGTYFEPFFGGGALFFALRPARAVLADANERLIRMYRGVRDDVDRVVALLRSYPHDASFFYSMRKVDIDARSDAEVAAWFIYLNRCGYNGLYRVNRQNQFNVPFGRYKNPNICNEAVLRRSSEALRTADLRIGDFESAIGAAKAGDFVYFDPPYVPLSATSSFTSYTPAAFDDGQQARLRDVARRLKDGGVSVLLSNSSAPSVRALYKKGFTVRSVAAKRAVNSDASKRGPVAELLIS